MDDDIVRPRAISRELHRNDVIPNYGLTNAKIFMADVTQR